MEYILDGVIVLLQLSTIALIWRDPRGRRRPPWGKAPPPRAPTR
jgi:hypothetical protein